MTGTGTQADPYIPTTLTEFIEAVGSSGAYVALTQDINAADDPAYSGELTDSVRILAQSVEGGGFSISGVTVRAANMIIFQHHSSAQVLNIDFRKWGHKKTASGATLQGYNASNYSTGFTGCRFSVTAENGSFGNHFLDHIMLHSCAMDATFTNAAGTGGGYNANYCTIDRTTLLLDGAHLATSMSGAFFHDVAFPRSACIFKNPKFHNGIYLSDNIGFEYGYIAFTDVADGLNGITLTSRVPVMGSIVAIDDPDVTMSIPAGVTRGTLDNLKDKDWLTSVGFLP